MLLSSRIISCADSGFCFLVLQIRWRIQELKGEIFFFFLNVLNSRVLSLGVNCFSHFVMVFFSRSSSKSPSRSPARRSRSRSLPRTMDRSQSRYTLLQTVNTTFICICILNCDWWHNYSNSCCRYLNRVFLRFSIQ